MSDLISRQAVLEIAEMSDFFESSDAFNDFLIALYDLPVIQIGQRWIPVTERVPEEGQAVLATIKSPYKKGKPFLELLVFFLNAWGEQRWFTGEDDFYRGESIIAWQPLPEPYREEKE